MPMEYANAEKFLKSYNRIESQLKILYGGRATQNFTDLVKRCTDLNMTVRRYENELIDYGKLRNAIVHRATDSEEVFIANPCDNVVENIAFIEKQLCHPPRITEAIKVKINSYGLYAELAARAEKGEDLNEFLTRTPCGSIVGEEILARYKIVPEDATVFDVFKAFEEKKDLLAVIVTEHGVQGEKALTIVTPADFPRINRYLETYNVKPF